MMGEPIRWGICGTGRIARKFAADLRFVPGAVVAAIGSRTREAAEVLGREHPAAHVHGSYESLAADDGVDVVYVATPQSRHHRDVLTFLRAGRPVLCEKPFAMSAAETLEMTAAARAAGVFLMEAMWMRFLPVYVELRQLVADGVIGTPHLLSADFGYRVEPGTPHRLLDRGLGGGSLLDLGIYPISLASMLLGAPEVITALCTVDPAAGVDNQTAAILRYSTGALAVLHSSILGSTPSGASITGSAGRISVARPFHAGTTMTLESSAGVKQISHPFDGVGLHFEAAEVMACLRAGRPESDVMPLAETAAIMSIVDEIRRQTDQA
jgi:predicted dehydrogenase